jgi:hypothetical protein
VPRPVARHFRHLPFALGALRPRGGRGRDKPKDDLAKARLGESPRAAQTLGPASLGVYFLRRPKGHARYPYSAAIMTFPVRQCRYFVQNPLPSSFGLRSQLLFKRFFTGASIGGGLNPATEHDRGLAHDVRSSARAPHAPGRRVRSRVIRPTLKRPLPGFLERSLLSENCPLLSRAAVSGVIESGAADRRRVEVGRRPPRRRVLHSFLPRCRHVSRGASYTSAACGCRRSTSARGHEGSYPPRCAKATSEWSDTPASDDWHARSAGDRRPSPTRTIHDESRPKKMFLIPERSLPGTSGGSVPAVDYFPQR